MSKYHNRLNWLTLTVPVSFLPVMLRIFLSLKTDSGPTGDTLFSLPDIIMAGLVLSITSISQISLVPLVRDVYNMLVLRLSIINIVFHSALFMLALFGGEKSTPPMIIMAVILDMAALILSFTANYLLDRYGY